MAITVDRSLRLPDSEYFPEPQRKSGIAIHHTVCDSARTTLDLWLKDRSAGGPRRVATAYVIDRDGTIFEAFDPEHWAWQFGLPWRDALRLPFEKRFIGIEIVSEGGLLERDGRLYAYGVVSPAMIRPVSEAFDCGTLYRGFRWYDRYEPEQLTSLGRLVDDLCTRFAIPRAYPEQPYLYYGEALARFDGVIGHAMVRADKSDPAPDPAVWETLRFLAGLTPVAVDPSARATALPTGLTRRAADALFARNARHINRMDTAAGSLVKNLLMELERRGTYLKLAEPEAQAHEVAYDVVEGDRGQVAPVARALGFRNATERVLQVSDR